MKAKKRLEARYQYKCRLCGEVHTHEVGGWNDFTIGSEMFVASHGNSPVFKKAKIHEISLVTYHVCASNGSFGVCDFIGVKKVEVIS